MKKRSSFIIGSVVLIAIAIIFLVITLSRAGRSKTLTITFGGDVMFDRNVRKMGQNNGYDSLFKDIKQDLLGDIVVVNLEGPMTSSSSRTLMPDGHTTGDFAFTFATTTAEILARNSINIVSLANNHTDNFGWEGFEETKYWLNRAGVGYFGDPWNGRDQRNISERNSDPISKSIAHGPFQIAFVGYHAFQAGFENVLTEIERLTKEGKFVIALPHWGEEYATTHSAFMEAQAEAMISAGAKAIIGSHPHVIMDNQIIAGVPVYYSLGNLIFDQYFSPETMKGNIIKLHLVNDGKGTKLTMSRFLRSKRRAGESAPYQVISPFDF